MAGLPYLSRDNLFDNIDFRTCLVNMTHCDTSDFGKYWQPCHKLLLLACQRTLAKPGRSNKAGYFKYNPKTFFETLICYKKCYVICTKRSLYKILKKPGKLYIMACHGEQTQKQKSSFFVSWKFFPRNKNRIMREPCVSNLISGCNLTQPGMLRSRYSMRAPAAAAYT